MGATWKGEGNYLKGEKQRVAIRQTKEAGTGVRKKGADSQRKRKKANTPGDRRWKRGGVFGGCGPIGGKK